MVKQIKLCITLGLAICMVGCSHTPTSQTPEQPITSVVSEDKLVSINKEETTSYNDKTLLPEETISTYETDNGLARIEKKPSYYEVYLDFEKGSHYDIGYAYGEAIKMSYPDFANVMEPYIYENIYLAFPEITDDFTPVIERINQMISTLNPEYVEEIEGLADSLVVDTDTFKMDGVLSREEMYLSQFVSDALRGTQCSGMAAYGEKTVTGQTITLRILEWPMGNENQMATAHAVIHFKNGDKSFTSYGVLGLLEVISGANNEGAFGAILDSATEGSYVSEGKKSYTFALRYALENFQTAKAVGEYMNGQVESFTFSHNILVSDPTAAYVAEDCVDQEGKPGLRYADSKLMNGLVWNNYDAIAVVNGYALEGNKDNMTNSDYNMIRWKKYNERLAAYDKVTIGDMMDIITKDDPNGYGSNLYSDYTYQVIVVDSASGSVYIAFAPTCDEYPLKPDFIKVTDNLYTSK